MATKNNPGPIDCYAKADPDEEYFILLGRDRHASALVRLWAWMREKEGEPEEVVAEARDCAQKLEDYAQRLGKITLNLDAVASLAATFKENQMSKAAPQSSVTGTGYTVREGQIVVAGRGRPAMLIRIFGPADDEKVQGMANIKLATGGVVTVDYTTLRPALAEEVEVYRRSGGEF